MPNSRANSITGRGVVLRKPRRSDGDGAGCEHPGIDRTQEPRLRKRPGQPIRGRGLARENAFHAVEGRFGCKLESQRR